jgi:hypothetical protein
MVADTWCNPRAAGNGQKGGSADDTWAQYATPGHR